MPDNDDLTLLTSLVGRSITAAQMDDDDSSIHLSLDDGRTVTIDGSGCVWEDPSPRRGDK